MFLECVTVCVNYDDFLHEIEPYNRAHFDRWIIVTSARDEKTRDFCKRRSLECLVTEDFYRDGAAFDKARAIDRAIQQLSQRDWILHIDADIVLPTSFTESLVDADLQKDTIYGADRYSIRGSEAWDNLKNSGFLHKYARCAHHAVCLPEGYPVGARWADSNQGYVPIGFFQLFHGTAIRYSGILSRRYSNYGHNDAARTDVQFGLLWDRNKRQVLPEVVVGHLEDKEGSYKKVGRNWEGRKTPRFGNDTKDKDVTVTS